MSYNKTEFVIYYTDKATAEKPPINADFLEYDYFETSSEEEAIKQWEQKHEKQEYKIIMIQRITSHVL